MQVILFTDVAEVHGYGKYAGTYKVATEIRKHGYTCQVVDLFTWYTPAQIELIIKKFITSEAIMVGFSATLMAKNYTTPDGRPWLFGRSDSEMQDIWTAIKIINSKCAIVVGGSGVNIMSGWDLVDFVIINKADSAIKFLLSHLVDNTDIKTVNLVKNTKIINGEDYFYTQEQFAQDQLKFESHDIIFHGESLPLEVARGCIFSCAFCRFDLIGKRVGDWQRQGQSLYNEIIYNYENFGSTHAMISDELINESLDKMKFLTDVFSRLPFKFSYSGYARIDLIYRYPEMRELFLESGANGLIFGIETLNDTVGKKIGKGLSSDKVKHTLQYCGELWKDKIWTRGNFIAGLPNETEDSIWKTVNYLLSDKNPLDLWDFMPMSIVDPNWGRNTSKIDKNPEKYGYTKLQNGWSNNNMTRQDAEKIVKKIFSMPEYQIKNKMGLLSWMGRIHNIGYSVTDLLAIRSDPNWTRQKWALDLIDRTAAKKNQYWQTLIKL